MPRTEPAVTASASSPVNAGSARSVLLTLLGEFVYPESTLVATGALLEAFACVDIAERSARQAINRSAASGWIEAVREGRRVSWRLTDSGHALIARGSRRLRAVREPMTDWDGQWLLLHVSVPDAQRVQRQRLYRALSWAGFGNPTPGLWICPHSDREADLGQILTDLELVSQALVFMARHVEVGVERADLVHRAWDLSAVGAHYEELHEQFIPGRSRSGGALREHILLVNALQRLPSVDPGLPLALLPEGWPGRPVIAELERYRAALAPKAHAEWRALLGKAA
ncbi:hypothetical protein FOZ76_02515 [Verticiella sediminum]|uniref:PaaX family transcriptional regulator n=1 Tax=Verticiella sediminum TaxID=1247510 RepID=A0A556B0E8_9BURK|nr:PaaX family transcriptional regulator C-terminal domain-containing protein [Verticiella sediminum]TSH98642.1 hypothetical protein FOZ76_02515 [Verticiella sediminum]